jgi:hypothetical protein
MLLRKAISVKLRKVNLVFLMIIDPEKVPEITGSKYPQQFQSAVAGRVKNAWAMLPDCRILG